LDGHTLAGDKHKQRSCRNNNVKRDGTRLWDDEYKRCNKDE
jgi:hypothetical protein